MYHLDERFEQIRFLGLDSPRCNRAIIHCLKWSRHCGATSPPYRTPLNRWTTNCKARTRATMQRLLHGLDTQVLGHVQKALPHDTIFPPITPLVLPPTLFLGECTRKQFLVLWWKRDSVELKAKEEP